MTRLKAGLEDIRRPIGVEPPKELTVTEQRIQDKVVASNIVSERLEKLRRWERRFEEIKQGKELSDLMMSDDTLTKVSTMKFIKEASYSTEQQRKKLQNLLKVKWIKSRSTNSKGGSVGQLDEMEKAKQLFRVWDKENKGYLTLNEVTESLMAVGLIFWP